MKTIPGTHLRNVCLVGKGEKCCRYIVAGAGGIQCAKGSTLGIVLDERVEQKIMVARGDNCMGPPDEPRAS